MSDEADDDNSEILAEAMSPNGNMMAIVQATPQSVHFYLNARPDTNFGMRAVWVRNLAAAPAGFDKEQLQRGEPPMMPAATCAHPHGAPPLDREKLRVVWFEEGDSAALFEGDEMLAAIPPWSGMNGFHGYARDCTGQSPLAWPLREATAVYERVARAEEFLKSWEPGRAHWPAVQEALLGAYERVLGKHTRYWGIDGGEWPPKAVASFETESAVVLLTLGVSIRPMPKVELAFEDPQPHRRIELGFAFERNMVDDGMIRDAVAYMSGQSNLPWHFYTWLGVGHTVQCEPCPAGGEFAAVVLVKDPRGAPAIAMPTYRGDPVNLLWMTPITTAEWKVAQERSSGEVLKRLQACGPIWPHGPRGSVV